MRLLPDAAPFSAAGRPDADGHRTAVLLSHGFTGSPASMRPWGAYLAERGYAVEVPRLPGHGTTWQQLNRTTWADWYAEVVRTFDRLRADNDRVVVGGLSMGGALALRLAAERTDQVDGVVVVNPAVATRRKDVLALPVLKHVVPALPGIANDIKKPGVQEYGYRRTPLKAVHSMMQGWAALRPRLGEITAPVLYFRSADDHVVDDSSHEIVLAALPAEQVDFRILPESFHVATLDNDAPTIYAESAAFIERLARTGEAVPETLSRPDTRAAGAPEAQP